MPTALELAYNWTQRLNRAAANDSFCLTLSERLSAEFWTADQLLASAVRVPWIRVISEA